MFKKSLFTNTVLNVISQIIRFFFTIFLARLLLPKYFGYYGISFLVVETSFMLTLWTFSIALIQAKHINDDDYNTVFNINMLVSIVISSLIFFSSSFIANYFNNSIIENLLKIHFLVIIIRAFTLVPNVKLSRELKFKELGLAQVFSVIAYGISALILIKLDFSVYSLVYANLFEFVTYAFFLIIFSKKYKTKFQLQFSLTNFKKFSSLGFGTSIQLIMNHIASNVDYFWIGKFCTPSNLAFYTRGYKLMAIPVYQIGSNFGRVLLPIFSKMQDDNNAIKLNFFKIVQASSIIIFPLFLIFFIYSKSLIFFIYGEKWLPTVPYLNLLIIAGTIKAMSTYIGTTLRAKGLIYYETINQIIFVSFMIIGGFIGAKFFGVMGICYIVIISSMIFWIRMIYAISNALAFKIFEYLKLLYIAMVQSTILFLWNFLLKNTIINYNFKDFTHCFIGISSSLILYFCLLLTFKNKFLFSSSLNYNFKNIFNFFKFMKISKK